MKVCFFVNFTTQGQSRRVHAKSFRGRKHRSRRRTAVSQFRGGSDRREKRRASKKLNAGRERGMQLERDLELERRYHQTNSEPRRTLGVTPTLGL